MRTISEQKKLLSSRWQVVSIAKMSAEDRLHYQTLARQFYNRTSESLSKYIQAPDEDNIRNAWTDVDQHLTNTYLVVDKNVGQIVFYFSLCCGMMYSDIFRSPDYSRSEIEFLNTYRQALVLRDRKSIRELAALTPQFHMEEAVKLMNSLFKAAKSDIKVTKEGDPSQFIAETFPGIELTHFCKNDQYFAKPLGVTLKTGAFVFWEFVLPEVKKTTKSSAARYLYLYAAESPVTRKLIPYYKEHLHFEQMSPLLNLKTIKPYYDFKCISMLEEIQQLDENKKEYYDSIK